MKVQLALCPVATLLAQKLARTAALLLALAGLATGYSAPAFAIFSCDAGAGPTVSGGSGDSCGLNKYQANAVSNVGGAGVAYAGSASTNLSTGSQSGAISLFDNTQDGIGPPVANGNFYSNLLVDFRISGPASAVPLPSILLVSATGNVVDDCVNCDGNISYNLLLQSFQGSPLNVGVSGGRTHNSNWTSNVYSSIGATGGLTSDSSGFHGALTFDAAGLVNLPLRLTANLSGTVAFTGPNPSGAAISADASNTGLFNLILPSGYTIVANPASVTLLTAPVLQVPEPATIGLMMAGLVMMLGAVAGRSSRGPMHD